MSRFIPNEKAKVYFLATLTDPTVVTASAVIAGVDLTRQTMSLNASTQGNTVPTPDLGSLFETSIPGTVQAAFSGDFYRDDTPAKDLAWTTLPRRTKGYFIISRTGPAAAGPLTTGDKVEVWPVMVVSRTMSNMASNTASTFTVQCSVNEEPQESVTLT